MNTYKDYLGIDISKETFDVVNQDYLMIENINHILLVNK